MIIDEDNLRGESGFNEFKLTIGSLGVRHIDSLEPVVLILVLPTGTRMSITSPSNPRSRIDKALIGMPIGRQDRFLLVSKGDIAAIGLFLCHLGTTQCILNRWVILPVLL